MQDPIKHQISAIEEKAKADLSLALLSLKSKIFELGKKPTHTSMEEYVRRQLVISDFLAGVWKLFLERNEALKKLGVEDNFSFSDFAKSVKYDDDVFISGVELDNMLNTFEAKVGKNQDNRLEDPKLAEEYDTKFRNRGKEK